MPKKMHSDSSNSKSCNTKLHKLAKKLIETNIFQDKCTSNKIRNSDIKDGFKFNWLNNLLMTNENQLATYITDDVHQVKAGNFINFENEDPTLQSYVYSYQFVNEIDITNLIVSNLQILSNDIVEYKYAYPLYNPVTFKELTIGEFINLAAFSGNEQVIAYSLSLQSALISILNQLDISNVLLQSNNNQPVFKTVEYQIISPINGRILNRIDTIGIIRYDYTLSGIKNPSWVMYGYGYVKC